MVQAEQNIGLEGSCPICRFGTVNSEYVCDTCSTRFCSICGGTIYFPYHNPRNVDSCTCPENVQPGPVYLPCYMVHRDGRVYRVEGHPRHIGEMKPQLTKYGYLKIKLRHKGYRQAFFLHRLVCEAFHGEPPVYGDEPAHCRHIDGNRLNNHADNLRWGSRIENEHDKKHFYKTLIGRP